MNNYSTGSLPESSRANGDSFQYNQTSTPQVNWSSFDLIKMNASSHQFQKTVLEFQVLKETNLKCVLDVGKWENRVQYIETIIDDVLLNCPKDEMLTIISLGSNQLLIEYISGKTLIEKGYKNVFFLMVDPGYLSARGSTTKPPYLNDFIDGITKVFEDVSGQPFEQERIKFLTRAQNIQKYFKPGSNILIIESLPPYSNAIKRIKLNKADLKKEEDLLRGSKIVSLENANSVSFVPDAIISSWESNKINVSEELPLDFLTLNPSSPHAQSFNNSIFFIDWGCKIYKDGSTSVSFTGSKRFFASYIEKGMQPTSEKIEQQGEKARGLILQIRSVVESKVKEIKSDNSDNCLTQEHISGLLLQISRIAKETFPLIECYYTRDYMVDRKEAVEYLSKNAGHHYRKCFKFLSSCNAAGNEIVAEVI